MRTLAAITTLTLIAFSATADDGGSWINLFDGETLYGWTALGDVRWEVDDGAITYAEGTGGLIATTSQFSNFELSLKLRLGAGGSAGLVFRGRLDGHPTENGSTVLWLSGGRSSMAPWREFLVSVRGPNLMVSDPIGGTEIDFVKGSNAVGHIALLYNRNNRAKVAMKDVRLRPLDIEPIFNGKNLEGWTIIPGHRSKFAVVDGAINITDGPGQIETTGVYKNFLAQLDILSNGEHLNSGVFFRSPPGEFWKGYESQIRNQFGRNDRTRPVDFGTGGNYGNQAARKVVSSDYEWFSKTIVVNGNHTAIWINGYQVSDFLDTRPISREAQGKTGYVNQAGTINLQGHDPTTDLSFKNINVQEYPE